MVNIQPVFLAPYNQQYLFLPASQNTFLKGIAKGHIRPSELETITDDFDKAKEVLQQMQPQSNLATNTPLIGVFQGRPAEYNPNKMPPDDLVALLHANPYLTEDKNLAPEMAANLVTGSSLDVLGDTIKILNVLSRVEIRGEDKFFKEIKKKLAMFNALSLIYSIAGNHNTQNLRGEELPSIAVRYVMNFSQALPRNVPLEGRWDYVESCDSSLIPNKELRGRWLEAELGDNKQYLRSVIDEMVKLRFEFGLTEQERTVLRTMEENWKLVEAKVALDKFGDLAAGKGILIPSQVHDIAEKLSAAWTIIMPR